MKKYAKPFIVGNDIVESINESTFLYGSGWYGSDCYQSAPEWRQGWLPNRRYIIYDTKSNHNWARVGVEHHNEAQYTIVEFNQALPSDAYGSINGYEFQMSTDGMRARALTHWHNNGVDNIGLGNLELHLEIPSYNDNATLYNQIQITSVEFYDDGINPETGLPFRLPGVS